MKIPAGNLARQREPMGKLWGRTASEKLRTDRHETRLDSWKTKTEGKQQNLSRRKIRLKISNQWSTLAAQKMKTEDLRRSLRAPSGCKQKKDSRAVGKINKEHDSTHKLLVGLNNAHIWPNQR
jgi:hypothetical protein